MKKNFLLGAAGVAIVASAALIASDSATDSATAGGRELVKFVKGSVQPVFAGSLGKGATNYVLDYKVTNAVSDAVKPGIRLELRTETGKTFGDVYDAATWRAAKDALGSKTELSSAASIRGADLASGASVDGLANFGAIDPNADKFDVRVYGLWDPVFRDRQGRTWMETRVLVLSYSRSGDEYDRQLDPIRLESSKEEIEGEVVQLHTGK
ncbi:MAG: hypothetical protein K8T90_14650 [Planctomycetes bacterium]|nr:hypothetical protein [Planctomycetota bacterium]